MHMEIILSVLYLHTVHVLFNFWEQYIHINLTTSCIYVGTGMESPHPATGAPMEAPSSQHWLLDNL